MIQAIHSKKYNSPLRAKQTQNDEYSGDYPDKEHKIIEDTMVSSILGTLFLLPDHLIWQILDESTGNSLSKLCEDVYLTEIQNIEFWSKWDCSKIESICNEKYVEPDVVLYLPDNQIVIIEAKRDISNKQSRVQWSNEILSAENKGYKIKCLIALDGNENITEEQVEGTKIVKATWQKIFYAVESLKDNNLNVIPQNRKSIGRILRQAIIAFGIFRYFPTLYLKSLTEIKISDEATKFFANNKI